MVARECFLRARVSTVQQLAPEDFPRNGLNKQLLEIQLEVGVYKEKARRKNLGEESLSHAVNFEKGAQVKHDFVSPDVTHWTPRADWQPRQSGC